MIFRYRFEKMFDFFNNKIKIGLDKLSLIRAVSTLKLSRSSFHLWQVNKTLAIETITLTYDLLLWTPVELLPILSLFFSPAIPLLCVLDDRIRLLPDPLDHGWSAAARQQCGPSACGDAVGCAARSCNGVRGQVLAVAGPGRDAAARRTPR